RFSYSRLVHEVISRINVSLIVSKVELSVIVPLFNEEESITPLFEAIHSVLKELHLSYEIIFVDDGSSDRTFEIAETLAKEHPELRAIKFRRNYGQTPAMAAGIDYAMGDILITMDGDLQNDPRDIPNFIEKINEGYDIVVGWRHKRQDKLVTRKIPSKIANWMIGKVTGVPIKDNGWSLKGYRAKVMKNVPFYSEMHRFIPAMTSITGAKIAEIKVRHHARQFGQSKYGLSRIFKVLSDLISIKMIIGFASRPLIGFGLLAIPPLILSIIALIWGVFYGIFMPGKSIIIFLGSSMLLGSLSMFLFFTGMLCEIIYKTGNINLEKLSLVTASTNETLNGDKLEVVNYE
ncbi:MAG: glycosyltransferase family 2 protein, partial [Calditrichia bacterium]